jgi:predicted peptidase
MNNRILQSLRVVFVALVSLSGSTMYAQVSEQNIDVLPGGAPSSFEVKSFIGSNHEEIRFSLFIPKEIESDQKLPLVLCLHGSGGNTEAAQVIGSAELQEKYPCYVMAPACPPEKLWTSSGVTESYLKKRPQYTENGLKSVEIELIEALEDLVAKHPIDPDRIYITGQSKGGIGTWGLIMAHPNRFAAAAPVCGSSDPSLASGIASIPIWIFHGSKDRTVPVENSREMFAALREAGGEPGYTEFPGVGHNSWPLVYQMNVFWDWLFKQHRN